MKNKSTKKVLLYMSVAIIIHDTIEQILFINIIYYIYIIYIIYNFSTFCPSLIHNIRTNWLWYVKSDHETTLCKFVYYL